MSEDVVGVFLNGPLQIKVQDFYRWRLLADTVDTANTLLDTHRVPGQVIIDQGGELLQIQPFGGRISPEQNLHGVRMPAPRPRFDLCLVHHTPGVLHRIPYLTATTRVARHLAAVA